MVAQWQYFTGNSHGQSNEACCDSKKSLETREGKCQAFAQEGGKARYAEKATTEDLSKKGTTESAKTKSAGS